MINPRRVEGFTYLRGRQVGVVKCCKYYRSRVICVIHWDLSERFLTPRECDGSLTESEISLAISSLIELELRKKVGVLPVTRGRDWHPLLRYQVNHQALTRALDGV